MEQTYPLYDFGGNGPVVNIAVANGFPPETYRVMAEPLTHQYRVISLLPRALWSPPPPPETLTSWRQKADDMLNGLRAHNLTDVTAIGHSMGAVASMLAVIAEPGRFRALVMLDPTLRPPYQLKILEALKALRLMHRFPLAQGARRRRSRFASTEEAYVYWRQRRLFADWSDEVLHHYAESMTQPAPDGDGVLLRWHPEWEARYYENIITDVWSDVPKLRGLLPTLVVRGAETDTFVEGACRKFARMVPDALMIDLPGQGHLFPQAAPDQTRAVIEDWLRTLPS